MSTIARIAACSWCGAGFTANTVGRPALYCSRPCRRARNDYAEMLPQWQADLAEQEDAAASWVRIRKPVPTVIRNRIAELQRHIASRPNGATG